MTSRRLAAVVAYPRRELGIRSATKVGRRTLSLAVGLLMLVAFAGLLYLSQASVAAGMRFRLSDSEKRSQDLQERNLALRQEIADLQRLATIVDHAARLGMVEAPLTGRWVACAMPASVASSPESSTFRLPAIGQPDSSLWSTLGHRLGLADRAGQHVAPR